MRFGNLRRLVWYVQLGIVVNLLSLIAIFIDFFNIGLVCRSMISSEALVISTIEAERREECQVEEPVVLVAKPTLSASLFEFIHGNRKLLKSAKAALVDAGHIREGDLEGSGVGHRIIFENGRYEVQFTVVNLRSPKEAKHGYNRLCHKDRKVTIRRDLSGSCEAIEQEAFYQQISELEKNPAHGEPFAWEFKIDYQELSGYVLMTYCWSSPLME